MTFQFTVNVGSLVAVFLDDVDRRWYGYELMKATGMASGQMYPILRKLTDAGWLDVDNEVVDTSEAKRPARRWYRLSASGKTEARTKLDDLRRRLAL